MIPVTPPKMPSRPPNNPPPIPPSPVPPPPTTPPFNSPKSIKLVTLNAQKIINRVRKGTIFTQRESVTLTQQLATPTSPNLKCRNERMFQCIKMRKRKNICKLNHTENILTALPFLQPTSYSLYSWTECRFQFYFVLLL